MLRYASDSYLLWKIKRDNYLKYSTLIAMLLEMKQKKVKSSELRNLFLHAGDFIEHIEL